jgi:hypothetical protein
MMHGRIGRFVRALIWYIHAFIMVWLAVMQLIDKPATNRSGIPSRKSLKLLSSLVGTLGSLARTEHITPDAMFHQILEQVLESSEVAQAFDGYVDHCRWCHLSKVAQEGCMVRVGSETFSLLMYLSNTTGFAQKTDQAAELLIAFYAEHSITLRLHKSPTQIKAASIN